MKNILIGVAVVLSLVILGGGAYLFLNRGGGDSEEFSKFGFENDAVGRPEVPTTEDTSYDDAGGEVADLYEYEEDSFGSSGDDGDAVASRSTGQFARIDTPESRSETAVNTGGGGASSAKSTGGGSVGGGGGITLDTPSVDPTDSSSLTLSVKSPQAGATFENSDGCPSVDPDDENQAPCTPSPIAQVFWEYGDSEAKITLELYNDENERVRTFTTKTQNSGRYTWEYSPTVGNGDYKIVATAYRADGTLLTTGASGYFTLADSDDPGTTNPNPEIPSPTGPAGATMCEGMNASKKSPGSGPGPCGSYEISVSSGGGCSSGMTGENAIVKAWQYNLEDGLYLRKGNSIRFSLKRDNAMVFRFKTDPAGSYPSLPYPLQFAYDEHTANGPTAIPFVTLSEKKCDFDYGKLITQSVSSNGSLVYDPITSAKNNCFKSDGFSNALLARITATGNESVAGNIAQHFPYCQLKPDTYYYLNVRFEDANNDPRFPDSPTRGKITCPDNANSKDVCGMVIGAN